MLEKNKNERFSYPEVVVGSCMEALTYAMKTDAPVVYTDMRVPSLFDETDSIAWSELCFYLSVAGRIPFGAAVNLLRVNLEECCLEVVSGTKEFRVHYEKLIVFSDTNLKGLPTPVEANKRFKVLDWMDVKQGMAHEHEHLEGDSNFVRHIHFYPTNRLDGIHLNNKDAVAVSFLEGEEVNHINSHGWDNNYARLKVIKMMEAAGITGSMIEQGRHRSIQVEHSFREIIPLDKNKYDEVPNVEFR